MDERAGGASPEASTSRSSSDEPPTCSHRSVRDVHAEYEVLRSKREHLSRQAEVL